MTSQNLSPWELRRWKKGFIHSFTETRRKSCLIYKPLNKSLFEEGQKQKLATKDTEEKQRSQRKIWEKEVTKIRRKPQRILGIVVRREKTKISLRIHGRRSRLVSQLNK